MSTPLLLLYVFLVYSGWASTSLWNLKINTAGESWAGTSYLELYTDSGVPQMIKKVSKGNRMTIKNIEGVDFMICNPGGDAWTGWISMKREGFPAISMKSQICLSTQFEEWGECMPTIDYYYSGACIYFFEKDYSQMYSEDDRHDMITGKYDPSFFNGYPFEVSYVDIEIDRSISGWSSTTASLIVKSDLNLDKSYLLSGTDQTVKLKNIPLINNLRICNNYHNEWLGNVKVIVVNGEEEEESKTEKEVCLSSEWLNPGECVGSIAEKGKFTYKEAGRCVYFDLSDFENKKKGYYYLSTDGKELFKLMESQHSGATVRVYTGSSSWSESSSLKIISDKNDFTKTIKGNGIVNYENIPFNEMIQVCETNGDAWTGWISVKVDGLGWPDKWFSTNNEVCLSTEWKIYTECVGGGIPAFRSGDCVNFNLAEFKNGDFKLRTKGYLTSSVIEPREAKITFFNYDYTHRRLFYYSDIGVNDILEINAKEENQNGIDQQIIKVKFFNNFHICRHDPEKFTGLIQISYFSPSTKETDRWSVDINKSHQPICLSNSWVDNVDKGYCTCRYSGECLYFDMSDVIDDIGNRLEYQKKHYSYTDGGWRLRSGEDYSKVCFKDSNLWDVISDIS